MSRASDFFYKFQGIHLASGLSLAYRWVDRRLVCPTSLPMVYSGTF